MNLIPDEGEIARTNEKTKWSELTYPNKKTYTETSAYNWILRALKNLDTSYNNNIPKIHEPIIKGKLKVTGYTRAIMIAVEQKEDEIHWACNMQISTDAGEPETLDNGKFVKRLKKLLDK